MIYHHVDRIVEPSSSKASAIMSPCLAYAVLIIGSGSLECQHGMHLASCMLWRRRVYAKLALQQFEQ